MSRKKMVNFDSDKIWSRVRDKCRCSEAQVRERIAKRLEVTPERVKVWFKDGRMPEAKFRVLTEYLDGNFPLRKNNSQTCFEEVEKPTKILLDGEELNLPWNEGCSSQACEQEFPAAAFFSNECYRFADIHPETYMTCLKELIIFDSMGGRT